MTASPAVRLEWQRRVVAEYAVCLSAQELAQRLTRFGSPPELIGGALEMALDELEHARLARGVCDAAGARGAVEFDPGAFLFESDVDRTAHIAVALVPNLCLGEVLATRINHRLRANARRPPARNALGRVAADEPRHAALGWAILDWLLTLEGSGEVRAAVSRHLPGWTASLRHSFASEGALPHLQDLTDDDLAWGLARPGDYEAVFEQTVARDLAPRLARRGFSFAPHGR